jgi:thiazolinyl imide reductase
MRRLRVLVCGSNYGRAYVTALAREPRKYQLTGILARGSVRSERLAALNLVPLFRSTDELPDNIDVACAAMSSAAWPVVLQLLRRRIHVICEHPYPSKELKDALDLARKRRMQFHVNGHFANLPGPAAFIRACRQARDGGPPELVEVLATERSLYATLDILLSAMGGDRLLRVHELSRNARFVLLEAALGKTRVRISVQVSGTPQKDRLPDGSPSYLVDQRLTAIFPTGVLTLCSTGGPVLWNRTATYAAGHGKPLYTTIYSHRENLCELTEERIQANVEALNAIRLSVLGHELPQAQWTEHILGVSSAWQAIGRKLYG